MPNEDGHNLVLHLQRHGRLTLLHDDAIVTAGIGDIIIADDSLPYAIDISDANDCLIFQMPVSHLGDRYRCDDWHGLLLPAGDPNVAFFDYILRGLWNNRDEFGDIDDAMGEVLSGAARVVCGSGSRGSTDEGCGVSPVAFALRHLDNPQLGTATICHATGLSSRAVQKAFLREVGLTPTAFINERRLQRSAERLVTSDASTITHIALDVGFNDPAFFSRCFRRRYGVTPREWRSKHGRPA